MTVRSRLAGSGAVSTSHAVTLPAGVVTGDRLIVGFVNDDTTADPSVASGWTQVGTTQDQGATTNHSLSVWTRVATGTDSLTVSLTASQEAEWVAICLEGDGGTPQFAFSGGGGNTGGTGTATVTAITGLASGDYDSIIFLGLDNSDGETHTITVPSGWDNLTHDFTSADVIGCWSMDDSATGVTGFSPADISFTNQEQFLTGHIVVPKAATGPVVGPTVRSAAGASGASGNDPAVVTKPAGLAVGDLMLAFHVGDNDVALADMTAPASWTEIASQAAVTGAQPAMKVWHRVATSTEVAASNFSFSAGGGGVFCSAGILAITAGTFDPTAPLSPTFTINASNSTTHVAPSLTGVVNGLLVTAHSTDQGGASGTSYTPPSGMTERVDTAASTGWTCVEINTLALTSTAATGTKSATCTANRPATSVSLIVSPASGAGIAVRTGGFLQLL